MKKFLLSLLIICSAFIAKAQSLENTMLWKVSGNGLQQPSYLFGTMHMICEANFVYSDKIRNALSQSKKLVLEINPKDSSEIAYAQKNMMNVTPITEELSEPEIEELDSLLGDYKIQLSNVKNLKPFVVVSLITMAELNKCGKIKMWESVLIDSLKNGQSIGSLENMKEQFTIVDSVYDAKTLLLQLRNKEMFDYQKISVLYKKENLNALNAMLNDPKVMTKAHFEIMLKNRNEKWISKMSTMMKNEPVFFGVGAGHLAGDYGLINLLRKQGYDVVAVK